MSRRHGGLRLKRIRPMYCRKCGKKMMEPGLTLKMVHEASCKGNMLSDYELCTVDRFEDHDDRVHIFFAEYPGLGCPFLKENLMRRGIFSLKQGQHLWIKGPMLAGESVDKTDIRMYLRLRVGSRFS